MKNNKQKLQEIDLELDQVIATLPPEVKRDFDRLRFVLGLYGASSDDVAAMAITFGYLVCAVGRTAVRPQ